MLRKWLGGEETATHSQKARNITPAAELNIYVDPEAAA